MKTIADFAGRWTVSREIVDARAATDVRFDGHAELSPQETTRLIYHEAGVLTLAGAAPMQAERRYLWRFDGDQIEVSFDDGRPFHRFSTKDGAEADHLCGQDLYEVTYTFDDWPRWSSRWRVRGPRKDYVMISRYAREDRC